jgi:glycine/D-amino acid oxidase-like deaminating enzyme
MITVDYLLTGQGLAGSVLALTLLQCGRRIMVVDQLEQSACSTIAAGVYNPFTYKRMVNSWEAETLTPFAQQFYEQAEVLTEASFHRRMETWKILADANESKQWERASEEGKSNFITPVISEYPFSDAVDAPYGIGIVKDCGAVDMVSFLAAIRKKLQAHQALQQEFFHVDRLVIHPDHVVYDGRIRAAVHVHCGGILANPHWKKIFSLIPVKGQLLHLYIPDLHAEHILSRGVYLLPVGQKRFICGATYELDQPDEQITSVGRDELLEKLTKFIRLPFTIEKQLAGIRPGVRDRRPILGRHPEHPSLAVFNGMGSKGTLLAPWLASCLIDHLEMDQPLHREVSVNRKALRKMQSNFNSMQ